MVVRKWRYIQWEFVIKSNRKQIHIAVIEHLENGIRSQSIQCPFCFERSVHSRETVGQYIEFAWNMANSDDDIESQTPMEDLPYLYTQDGKLLVC